MNSSNVCHDVSNSLCIASTIHDLLILSVYHIFVFSDMNFDQLSAEFLQQQPLLSSQIIPDLADDNLLVKKSIKTEPIAEKKTAPSQQNVYRVVPSNSLNASKSPIKTAANVSTQKAQFVKKIPMNVIQPTLGSVKANTVASENVTANTPIVINKMNGNISGSTKIRKLKFMNRSLIDYFSCEFSRDSQGDTSEKGTQSKVNHSSVLIEKWHRHSFDQNY